GRRRHPNRSLWPEPSLASFASAPDQPVPTGSPPVLKKPVFLPPARPPLFVQLFSTVIHRFRLFSTVYNRSQVFSAVLTRIGGRHPAVDGEEASRRLRRSVAGEEADRFRHVPGIDIHAQGGPLAVEILQFRVGDPVVPR